MSFLEIISKHWISLATACHFMIISASPLYCTNTKIKNYDFSPLIAVPVFASHQEIANYESNSAYYVKSHGISVTIIRYYDHHQGNCTDKQVIMYYDEFEQWARNHDGSREYCNVSLHPDIPWSSPTSLYFADDQRFILLIACNSWQTNITVLAGCFMVKEGRDLKQELKSFLIANHISEFPLFKVNFEDRLESFRNNPAADSTQDGEILNCTKRGEMLNGSVIGSSWVIALSICIMVVIVIVMTYVLSKTNQAVVAPSNSGRNRITVKRIWQ